MPVEYILALLSLTAGGVLGSCLSIALARRATKLPRNLAGYAGLAVWFAASSAGVWLRFTQVDNALAAQHARNVGMFVGFIAIWIALSVLGTMLGAVLASRIGQHRRPAV